jgi:hypothetical protein
MRPSNKSRSRNKPGNNGNNNNNNNQRRNSMGNIINRVFESAGPDGKVRGTPQQIIDKYQALARDAQVSGDRVAAESYLQHSEHYSRMLGEAQRQQAENRASQEREEGAREDGGGGFDQQQRRPQQQQPAQPPVASGLAMIDPDDSDDMRGPVETPEGRRNVLDGPAPLVRAEPSASRGNGKAEPVAEPPAAEVRPADEPPAAAEPAAAEAAPVPAAPKRRPRRPRATAEAPVPVATAEAE